MVLGLLADSHTIANLHDKPELTANFPGPALWHHIESTADTTGADPAPEAKFSRHVHEKDKFGRAGLTNRASEMVSPPRIHACALHQPSPLFRSWQ